jgi:peptide methionine sulfoxide reductase msrA/msrB
MKNILIAATILGLVGFWLYSGQSKSQMVAEDMEVEVNEMKDQTISSNLDTTHLPNNPNVSLMFDTDNLKEIYLAGGCFWGLEAYITRIPGVYDVTSGYANGLTENPSYEDLIYNDSGHAETVHVRYDPEIVDLNTILTYYFNVVDPTSVNKQGNDRGVQYRSGIYYTDVMDMEIINAAIKEEQ